MSLLTLQQPSTSPDICAVTGTCPLPEPPPPVAPGLMFVATGLVLVGVIGLRRHRARGRS